jgi:LPXTG-motif cell wall-anchored protein
MSVTDQIIQDVKDGSLDGTYTVAQLEDALHSPLLKVYGGGDHAVGLVQQALVGHPVASGNLPFTGAEMIVFALVGLTLLIAGIILRRNTRDRSAI